MSHRRHRGRTARTFQRRAARGLRFERLELREMLAADFGDAANYAIASHEAVGPLLGQFRDANAQVLTTLANGDASDEDGVAFSLLRAGQSATVTVHVANAPAGAKLSAWIDFNRDRDFIDADERIIANLSVVAGDNVIEFTVPAAVVGGANYARFRLSTAGNLGSAGAAINGEVEDYLIPIADAGSGIFGGQQPIGFDGVDQIAVVDLDGDGDADILNGNLKWRSNANGRFGPVTATGVNGTSGGMLAPADVDGDGDIDFFAEASGVVWYENNGLETFARRTVEANVTPFGLAPVDLDGDGDVDLVSASGQSTVDWYVNDGNQVFTKTAIASQLGTVQFVAVHDVDGDGDPDILAGTPGSTNSTIWWLENDGQQQFAVRTLATAGRNLSDLAAGDFDGDGDLEVVASFTTTTGGVVFYENDAAETFTPVNLDTVTWSASAIDVADLDADGDLDIAASGSNGVVWYENDAAALFTRRVVAAASGTQLGVTAADVNGDGRLDLVTTGTSSVPLAWYEQLAGLEDDYGDAPRPYRVFAQDLGPRHRAIGPQLGATRDADSDGAHSPTGGETDDGVLFGAFSLSQSTGTITVNVQNAPAGAKLDAWIDFDGDGSWGREGEQIATGLSVVAGDNTLTIVLPSWAVAGATYARFRLSTAGGLGPLGAALDGEVEDHPVVIADRAPATGLFPQPQLIGYGGEFLVAADVDGDGDADVVARGSGGYAWSENLGSAGFATHSVAASGLAYEDFAVGDLDSDGDLDFVGFGVVQQQQLLIWAENDGAQNFTRRTFALTGVPSVVVALAMADVDADGDMDILAAAEESGIYLLVNDGRQEFSARFIGRLGRIAATVVAADVDQDGDLDIVAGGKGEPSYGAEYAYDAGWFQNNGELQFSWRGIQLRTISGLASGSSQSVAVGDVDGDGDLDIVSAGVGTGSATTLWWHEQLANQSFVSHSLEVERNYRWATLADFDVDGDLDIVTISYNRTVDLYENLSGGRFLRRQITATLETGHSSAAADIDRDGDLDLVVMHATARGLVSWFENVNLVDPDYGDAPAPYPSTQSAGGAYHYGGGPRLGASRTSEADGVSSASADGDAGDDGVGISALQVGQALASATVNVQNAPAGAKLDAWIDFNGDGVWSGAGEQIFASYDVVEGDNVLHFRIPASAIAGSTVARFRLSTAGGLPTVGAAYDGEVEDYLLAIAAPAPATGEYAAGAPIGQTVRSLQMADIDGDGDADFLAIRPLLAWYENLGDGAFLPHSRNLAHPGYAFNARPIDLDGDGDIDFALVTSNGIAWLKNDGLQNFAYQAATPTANYSLSGVFDLADVDGDGDLDALAALSAASTQSIILFRNDGQNFIASTKLTTINVASSAIRAADVDSDGDVDFAVTFEGGNSTGGVAWYENAGGVWTFHDVTRNSPSEPNRAGRDVVPMDFDFDGDVDLVASTYAGNQLGLEIFRNGGNQNFFRETLATTASSAEFSSTQSRGGRLQVADLDGDGDYDAVVGGNRNVWLYQNQGAAGFRQSALLNEFYDTLGAVVAIGDVDGDRRLEILAAYGMFGPVLRLDDRPLGDYDRNGTVDQADRDLYEATLGQPAVPPGSGADGDRSGVVDAADLAIWEANQGASAVPPLKAADFNGDERVDGNDFLHWQRNYGATTHFPGTHYVDVDFSSAVDAGDLAAWKRHFGAGTSTPASATAAASVVTVESVVAPNSVSTVESVTAAPVSSAMSVASAMAVASLPLQSTPATLPPSPSSSSQFALPVGVVLALPVEKPVNKRADAHHLKRSSTLPRDAAFASLASPALLPLRHQRLATELSPYASGNEEAAVEVTAALSDRSDKLVTSIRTR